MAVIGTAKNARITARPVLTYDDQIEDDELLLLIEARSGAYRFIISDWDNIAYIERRKPSPIRLSSGSVPQPVLRSSIFTIEIVEHSLKILDADGFVCTQATDSMHSGSGTVDLVNGDLISLDNLDTPNKVRKLLSKGEQVKTCYSLGEPVKKLYAYGNLIYEA